MRALTIPIAVALGALIIFFVTPSEAAYFLTDSTNVGEIDSFIIEDGSAGSPASEVLWVQTVLGDPTVDWTISEANVPYEETTTGGIWAFEILDDPEYFIVKNSTRIALFSNNVDLGFGVFNQASLSSAINIPTDPWQISHVTSLNGDGGGGGGGDSNVPEPRLSLLIGPGLMGIGFVRKHR